MKGQQSERRGGAQLNVTYTTCDLNFKLFQQLILFKIRTFEHMY